MSHSQTEQQQLPIEATRDEEDSDSWETEEESEENEDDYEEDFDDEEDSEDYDDEEEEEDFDDGEVHDVICFSESMDATEYEQKIKTKGAIILQHPEEFFRMCIFNNEGKFKNEEELVRCTTLLNKRKSKEECENILNEEEKKIIAADPYSYTIVLVTSKEDYKKKTPITQLASFLLEYSDTLNGAIVNVKFLDEYFDSRHHADHIIYSDDNDFTIGLPFQSYSHPVLLLYGREQSKNEMIEYFKEHEVTVLSKEVYDSQSVLLGDCTIILSDDFFLKKPEELTLEEIDILHFYIHTNGITFSRTKELFDECKDVSTDDYDSCEEMLRRSGYFNQVYNFSVFKKRKDRRHLLDNKEVEAYSQDLASLPAVPEHQRLSIKIPNEIFYHIIQFMLPSEILQLRLLNNLSNIMCLQDFVWKQVCYHTAKRFKQFLSPFLEDKIYDMPYFLIYRNYINPLLIDLKYIHRVFDLPLVDKKLLEESISTALFIDTSLCKDEDIPIGSTKMGGAYDMPSNFDTQNIVDHSLLLQLNLEEDQKGGLFGLSYHNLSKRLKSNTWIPKTGVMYFFYKMDSEAKVFYFNGPISKLTRFGSGLEKSTFRVKFYEALEVKDYSEMQFTTDFLKFEEEYSEDLSSSLAQFIHAPYIQYEPHKLFGQCPVVPKEDFSDYDNGTDSSSEDDEEEDTYGYLDLNEFLFPLLQLSKDSKIQENNILAFEDQADINFLVEGEPEHFVFDKDSSWKKVLDCGDGHGLFQLDETFHFSYGITERIFNKFKKLGKEKMVKKRSEM
ncbi:hypothetical protein FDP41_011835 [Naegleria fowleri]|uniref:F-box domain-containing protein n=1 Tax=Naegleria fowleri TaxID=5763 RepID=A0A6A5C668_NAEFO|nr:uncharacterized protein FDP41_011835 [Naegleria fowleri]KAF0981974.1 hypothetical protein FDP41_011835 [Naegleria fowleri]